MSWTYVGPVNDVGTVRFLIGDTVSTTPLLMDEEISFTVAQRPGDLYEAAARCCEAIAAKLGQETDIRLGGELDAKLSQRRTAFRERAAELRRLAATYAMPYAGGIDVADKQTNAQDTTRVQPLLHRGQHHFPGTVFTPTPYVEEVEP